MRAYLAISWLGEVVISRDHRTGIHPLEHHLWHERKVRAERRKTVHRLVVVVVATAVVVVVVVVVIVGRASVRRMYLTPSSTGSPSW
jgi:archaellum biogenesis protein FlaJ (TadC family)